VPKPTAFVIEAAGRPRKLFTVQERGSGDLTLILRSRVGYAELGTKPGPENPTFVEHRYSIHVSPNSTQGINTIKRTARFSNDQKLRHFTFTKSLKTENSFVPLFFNRCLTLVSPTFAVAGNKDQLHSIGSYNPLANTLIFGVYVSKIGSIFNLGDGTGNNISKDFRNFSLQILWSFRRVPSVNWGSMINYGTEPRELYSGEPSPAESNGGFIDGFTELDCFTNFCTARSLLCQSSFQNLVEFPRSGVGSFTTDGNIRPWD
jgi:hypothetical protein